MTEAPVTAYVFFFFLTLQLYLINYLFFFLRTTIATKLPLWAKIAIVATVLTVVIGGAVGTGVYFAIKG